ncbi:hypothetical protein B0A48_08243 [Cryoendolithus antarcticus]|uniref:Rab-GAP TBC domain-containing protein n=1 Tax=Cryoendolithus antarcticus TaxID=1507870 RepID=A0A1V8T530_9PEZI|nr:hypothetical protein B0A48_08243 [Cryoendolithus antarcticus]
MAEAERENTSRHGEEMSTKEELDLEASSSEEEDDELETPSVFYDSQTSAGGRDEYFGEHIVEHAQADSQTSSTTTRLLSASPNAPSLSTVDGEAVSTQEDIIGGVDLDEAPVAETKPRSEDEIHEAEEETDEDIAEPEMEQVSTVADAIDHAAQETVQPPEPVRVEVNQLFRASTDDLTESPVDELACGNDPDQVPEAQSYVSAKRTASPEPETPVSPLTPREERFSTASMASIDLSDTDLDYDQYSAEQLNEFLATPRASSMRNSRHMRKPSSLEILQNAWAPSRQSTLFDAAKDKPPETPAEGEGVDEGNTGHSVHFETADAVSMRSVSTTPSVTVVRAGSVRSINSNGTATRGSRSSDEESNEVDWSQLERNEQQEKTDKELGEGVEDESTAFLLARLEQENALLTSNPKAATNWNESRKRRESRPPSIAHLKKLVNGTNEGVSHRFSIASTMTVPEEPPPMTELEFWAALVQDYPSTATRLPTLTTSKIRSGIPLPLRGVVWQSMAGARDKHLEESFDRLVGETSPYEGIINKDVGRSFPGVELFRDADGEGQKMLGRVLKCFSLHDKEIGYCQGLGFLVGPLLMNMGEREAFCVLVRLMDHYSLQASFLPSLSGLHMRIYQFSALLKQLHPALSEHFAGLGIEPAYLSQWFLSFFAVTCPLPMLFRIYDVIFAEGANETVMRVALALIRRNQQTLLNSNEFEDIMQLLLGRAVWDSYGCNPDELVDDFTTLGSEITHSRLAELEREFESQSNEVVGERAGFLPDVQAAAGRFLGRLWAPNHTPTKSTSTLAPASAEKDRGSFLRRSPSKQSMSTLNDGYDGTSSGSGSTGSTAATEVDDSHRESSADAMSMKSKAESIRTTQSYAPGMSKEDRDLHSQIEDLLTALSEMQREHAMMAAMLQREREERNDDHRVVRQLVGRLQGGEGDSKVTSVEERRRTMPAPSKDVVSERRLSQPDARRSRDDDDVSQLLEQVTERLDINPRYSASFETKAHLRNALTRSREQLGTEEHRNRDLTARIEEATSTIVAFQVDNDDLRSEVDELRTRVNEEFKERQRLDHTVRDLQAQARSVERRERLKRESSMNEVPTLSRINTNDDGRRGSMIGSPAGLRELKLGRRESTSSMERMRPMRGSSRALPPPPPEKDDPPRPVEVNEPSSTSSTPTVSPQAALPPSLPAAPGNLLAPPPPVTSGGFHSRSSSLATQAILATPSHEPAPEEALLLELVNAKTAEAQARQEVDELKRSLAIQKRKQDEALQLALTQAKAAIAEAETLKAAESARLETIARAEAEEKAEAEKAEMNMLIANSSEPGTPGEESGSGGVSIAVTPSATEGGGEGGEKRTPSAGSGGGWFWSRRTASVNVTKAGTP